jgi:exodeoxyribonuclease-5
MKQIALQAIHDHLVKEFPHTPTEEQGKLLYWLAKFYCSDVKQPLLVINGHAGTGKTTLIGAFVRSLASLGLKSVLLAPTGRAAKIFSQKSGKNAMTIHKKIFQTERESGGGLRMQLAPNLHTNTIFLIDEVSMISDQYEGNAQGGSLLDLLIQYIYNGKNCRAIFIGDNAQLPPVGSSDSPALNEDYLKSHYPQLTVGSFHLKEVLRQSEDSAILQNANILRSQTKVAFPKFQLQPQSDVVRIAGDELQDALESAYSHGVDEVIILTRSNKRANLFNQQIRARILWMEEEINGGDRLMVVKNNYHWLPPESPAGFIANGEMLQLEKIIRIEEMYGLKFADAEIAMVDYPEMDRFPVKLLLDTLTLESPNLGKTATEELYNALEKDYSWEKNKRKRLERIKNDAYFNALQVKHAYAITCHKAQGGQWPYVFIDQGYLSEDMLDQDYFRWLYTAFTRATEKLFLVNFENQFFDDAEN